MTWQQAVEVAYRNSARHGVRYRMYSVRWSYGDPRWRWFVCPVEGRGADG